MDNEIISGNSKNNNNELAQEFRIRVSDAPVFEFQVEKLSTPEDVFREMKNDGKQTMFS